MGELVLNDPTPFVPHTMAKRDKLVDYEAKMLGGQRYIACRNPQEAKKDAADRASIVAALKRSRNEKVQCQAASATADSLVRSAFSKSHC